ncbi:MAG: F0F1 ATP synthase subunit delta [Desulfobacterales bacterium]
MLIDWFTIAAQALNFLILIWLMKRFLYKPILHAIDAREQRIAKELADAGEKMAEAQKEREAFKRKNKEFDLQRDALLSQATQEAEAERQRLLAEARQAVEVLHAKQRDAMEREQQILKDEITRRTREEVFAIARKTLTDLAGTSLEERISDVFRRRLRELDGEAKEGFARILKKSSDPVFVRSAFELPSEQRAAIQHALDETFSAEIHVLFETVPDVISGIELTANGRKVAWSIADYLTSLDKSVGELLNEPSESKSKTETEPEMQAGPKPKSGTQPAAAEEAG